MPSPHDDDSSFERITPITPNAAQPQSEAAEPIAAEPSKQALPKGWFLPLAFTVLVLALGFVLFWLPERLSTPDPAQIQTPPDPTATGEADVPPEPGTLADSPENISFDTEAVLEQRRDAQALGERAREKQNVLVGRGLPQWAETQAKTLNQQLAQADTHFANRDFGAAQQGYQQSLDKIKQLQDRAEQLLAESLSRGQAALKAGDDDIALEAFELALTLDPDNATAKRGKRRALNLEAVLSHLNAAESAEASGELEQARADFQAALELDPQHEKVRAGLARIEKALAEKAFSEKMSEGMLALNRENYKSAQSAFQQALNLKTGAPAARDGLEQARLGLQAQRIETLRSQALGAERNEQWSRAREHYTQILDIDASLAFAQKGQQRTDQRTQLDARLQGHIDQPSRLSAHSVRQDAKQALAWAASINSPEPKLQRQASQLSRLLEEASTPVPVTLYSDGETQIIVYPISQIGELGQFTTKSVTLTPGQYTAIGRRPGYREVRVPFTVTSEGVTEPLVIKTEEQI